MSRSIILTLFFAAAAVLCQAQEYVPSPAFTVFGGYNYTHTDYSFEANGFDVSASLRATPHIYLKGDFKTGFNSGEHLLTYTFGPSYSFRAGRQFRPFIEVLAGGAHLSATGFGESAFAVQTGGGLDVNRTHWGLRVVEVDYLYTHFAGNGQNNVQVATGVLFHF